ncbi:haloacid dehalogenase-like hydrolase superfamily protein [Striga asiatica]|uniref:Haloacid dehalogenase-like hydrolase superfamily protein n=1 Tax=Striga asiatica TaxID=4170 RepID=A0A5A7QHQ0_STRAF|nr:haloacid dehalogenase-like hydrolase superfamily protein [Striga asiatica]
MEAARCSGSKYNCLLFDMDDTLYPLSLGINIACRKNIEEYMLHHLNIEESDVPRMCLELYKEYGTTMAGLKALGYEFDSDEFHACVHGTLPYELLKPDPVLRSLLLSMPQKKIIFTNADEAHVAQVLHRLKLEDCFHGVICFETLNQRHKNVKQINGVDEKCREGVEEHTQDVVDANQRILCKPSTEAIEAAIHIANIDPKKTIFFDDSVRNIASGKAAGLHTVIVGRSTLVPGADHALNSIHNIREALPEIWEDEGEHLDQILQSSAVETVLA